MYTHGTDSCSVTSFCWIVTLNRLKEERNMSNSVGHSLLRGPVLQHQSQKNSCSCIGGNTLFQAQATSLIRKSSSSALSSILSSDFRGHRLTLRRSGLRNPVFSDVVQAVLATDPASEVPFCHFINIIDVLYLLQWIIAVNYGNRIFLKRAVISFL